VALEIRTRPWTPSSRAAPPITGAALVERARLRKACASAHAPRERDAVGGEVCALLHVVRMSTPERCEHEPFPPPGHAFTLDVQRAPAAREEDDDQDDDRYANMPCTD
jgi:hypothetical protein